MIARESTWAEVEMGDYIRDKTGEVWKVAEQDDAQPGRFMLENRAGRAAWLAGPMPPAKPVTKMTPTQDEAIAVVRKVLGGTVLRDTH